MLHRLKFYPLLLLLALLVSPTYAQTPPLNELFTAAAAEFDLPADLLLALAYTRSHLRPQISEAGEVGLLQLPTSAPDQTAQAAQLLNLSADEIKTDNRQNVRGAAALLRQIAAQKYPDRAELSAGEWFEVTAAFSFPANPELGRDHARQVFQVWGEGLAINIDGENLNIAAWPPAREWGQRPDVTIASDDYAPARWVAAAPTNYTNGQRAAGDIDMIVIHTTEGSYSGAINWFSRAGSAASAHYVIRSADGEITQMVRHKDVAWHAGHWATNLRSIGIEHEAFVNDASWYTPAMYQASARLVRHLAASYSIPLDRAHIIGHVEVPGCPTGGGGASCHTDPGRYWDWAYFMQLVLADSPTATPPPTPPPAATGSLVGLVLNAVDNSRLAGAQVTAGGKTTLANQNGVYLLTGLPAGPIDVTVTQPGFAPAIKTAEVTVETTRWASVWLTPVAAPPTPTPLPPPTATPVPTPTATPLPLPPAGPTGTLVGLITDAVTGQRLAGVTVSAAGQTYVTDSRGYYRLDALPAGTQVVTAQKTGYVSGQNQRVVTANSIQWNSLKLQPQ